MRLENIIGRPAGAAIRNAYSTYKDRQELHRIKPIDCKSNYLLHKQNFDHATLFVSGETAQLWDRTKNKIGRFTIPDGSGGVNPGDRRAIFYLVSEFKPSAVLEIGTHIGASTLHIAAAMYEAQLASGQESSLTSVDIVDVNSMDNKPWQRFGSEYPPQEMINHLGYGSFVRFIADTSLHFAATCKQNFDFIFLDGSHSAGIVYQEIPLALSLLNQNGIILLHDYFHGLRPLWSDGAMIPGPYLATERLKKEGANLCVLPLGKLPWLTKKGTDVTSLALLLRDN